MAVAHEWHLTPAEFWALPRNERITMIAWVEARNEMTSHESQIEEKKLKPKG